MVSTRLTLLASCDTVVLRSDNLRTGKNNVRTNSRPLSEESMLRDDEPTLENFRRIVDFWNRPSEGFGQIYKITPLVFDTKPNGYVGRTVQSMYWRLIDHCSYKLKMYTLHNGIAKYGPANFKVEIIEEHIPVHELPAAEKKYVALFDTLRNGYNETEGGETAPMCCPQIREKQKAALARPEVKANFSAAGKKRMADPAVVAKMKATAAITYQDPEVIERKSQACKRQRQDPMLELQRGFAKRATTLKKRAEKRDTLKTERERRAFDSRNGIQDRYNAKHGVSKTMQLILARELSGSV